MKNESVQYDFLPHYKEDGLSSFNIRLLNKAIPPDDGIPLDLTGCKVLMQLRSSYRNKLIWEFSNEIGGDTLLTIPNPTDGRIVFPEILSWDIPASTYNYDLQVTDSNGFITTYMKGTWSVNPDVSTKKQ